MICPDGVVFNSTLGTQYELVYSSTLYLPEGFHVTYINQTNQTGFWVRTADIVAIGAIQNIGAGVINTNSGGTALVLNGGHFSVGDILQGEGNAGLSKTHHKFDLKVIYIPPSEMQLSLGNFPVGYWTQQGTVASEQISFSVRACISIVNVTWVVPDFIPTNQSFNVVVPAHPGHNVTYGIRIGEENTSYSKYNHSSDVFFTWTNISKTIPLIFDEEGMKTVMLTASNLLSSSQHACQIGVLDRVENVFLFNITPTPLGNETEISWVVEGGTNVTYNVSFGDGYFVNDSFSSVAILVVSYIHMYFEEGNYNVTVSGYNLASNQTATKIAQVQAAIVNVTCEVIHAARDIEVNETILLNASYPQGSNAKAFIDFGDGSSVVESSKETLICFNVSCRRRYNKVVSHSYFPHANYSANMTFVNIVSKKTCLVEVFVHKPVSKLTGFNITCPPTNLSIPTPCMLSIIGGNDFWCDWQFGADDQRSESHYWNLTLPVENTYLAVGNYTVTANCSNRLYNTSVVGMAIVQEPITVFLVTCPDAQSIDADFDLLIAVTTGTSMQFKITLKNVYGNYLTVQKTYITDFKSQIINFSRQNFSVVGIYLLTVKVVNLVTSLQIFTQEIKVDKGITSLRLLNNDTFICVNATTESSILIDTGTNVTVEWDFKDGWRSTSLFSGDSLRFSGDHLAHSYRHHGAYLLNVTASNPVSSMTVLKFIFVQYVVTDIQVTSDGPKEIPPGTVTFTVSVGPDTHPPTNATIDMDFGDGQTRTDIPLGGAQAINISSSYVNPGIIPVNMTMKNDVSSINFRLWVDVQRSIKNLRNLAYHTGGDAGYGAPGKGPKNDSFPLEHQVLLLANISDGTAVTYTWDFGDGTPVVETNETTVLHGFVSPHYFNVTLKARNSISSMVVNRVIRMMESVFNVTFENDSPTVIDFNTMFFITIGQEGTDSCFLVDLGNNTKILYKGISAATCNNALVTTNDIRILPSHNFTIKFTYWRTVNYFVKITGLNDVSRTTVHGWAIILLLPCKFPVVRIPDAGRSYHTATKYFRADYVTIKSRCTVDCLASRTTAFQWELAKISDGDKNSTTIQSDLFDKTLSVLIIPKQTLPYGRYMLRLNVSMVGLSLVYRWADAYMEIMPSPLVAEIIGGNAWIQSINRKVIFDASPSHDPDYGLHDKRGLRYFWYCKTADEDYVFPTIPEQNSNSTIISKHDGCFRNGTRRLLVSTEVLEIPPGLLWVNKTYIFKFLITKESRMAVHLVHISLTLEDPPTMVIR